MISRFTLYTALVHCLSLLITLRLSILLLACVILGGTSQYIYTYKVPLYLIALGFIGLILSSRNRHPLSKLLILPNLLIAGFIGLFVIYSIPINPVIWSSLSGRAFSVEVFNLLGQPLPWLPVSLNPEITFLSLLDFLPIIAILLITHLSKNDNELIWGVYSFLFIVFVSVLLGMVQLINSEVFSLYEIYNVGRPVGFFSNTNHFACLCAMAIPIAYKIMFDRSSSSRSSFMSMKKWFFGGIFIIAFSMGCILSGSGAGYVMLLIGFTFSPMILLKDNKHITKLALFLIFSLVILVSDFVFFSGEFSQIMSKFSSNTSRNQIYNTVLSFRKDYGVFGIGPGAFIDVYKVHEARFAISNLYVNQVHNDYLQLWLEFGVLGLLTIMIGLLAFIFLGYKHISQNWRLASIYLLSVFMPILQSGVDYPFRTIAISAAFVFILSVMFRKI